MKLSAFQISQAIKNLSQPKNKHHHNIYKALLHVKDSQKTNPAYSTKENIKAG